MSVVQELWICWISDRLFQYLALWLSLWKLVISDWSFSPFKFLYVRSGHVHIYIYYCSTDNNSRIITMLIMAPPINGKRTDYPNGILELLHSSTPQTVLSRLSLLVLKKKNLKPSSDRIFKMMNSLNCLPITRKKKTLNRKYMLHNKTIGNCHLGLIPGSHHSPRTELRWAYEQHLLQSKNSWLAEKELKITAAKQKETAYLTLVRLY